MMCQECGKRPATAVYAEIVHDKKTVFHLCQECVSRKKGAQTLANMTFSIGSLLGEWLKTEETPDGAKQLSCEQCGLSYAEFRESGKLGCGGCYAAFSEELDGLLERIQGDSRHKGKQRKPTVREGTVPVTSAPELEAQLKEAVAREQFEEAAKLRDELARLKGGEKEGCAQAHRLEAEGGP